MSNLPRPLAKPSKGLGLLNAISSPSSSPLASPSRATSSPILTSKSNGGSTATSQIFNHQPQNLIAMSSAVSTHHGEKKSKSSDSSSTKTQKRGWEPWSGKEIQVFFESLERFGRDFEQIQQAVGSKHYQQVRHFYYRLLKKINKIMEPSGLTIDKKNPTEISQALHCYWEVKKKMSASHPEMEGEGTSLTAAQSAEFSKHFLGLVQNTVVSKRNDGEHKQPFRSISNPDVHYSSSTSFASSSAPTSATTSPLTMESFVADSNPQLTLQLLPKTDDIGNYISSLQHNPKLQITLAHDKQVSYVIQHLTKKWGDRNRLPHPFRLYPIDDKSHKGWGEGDSIPLRFICGKQANYSLLKFSYDWDTIQPTPLPSSSSSSSLSTLPNDIPHFRSLTLPSPSSSSSVPVHLPSLYSNLKKPANSTSSPTLSDLYRTMLSQSTSPIRSSESIPSKSSGDDTPPGSPDSPHLPEDTDVKQESSNLHSLSEASKTRSYAGATGRDYGCIVNPALIDEISCDGFESTETVCDSDEMDCKKFYSTFESNDSNSFFEQNDNSNSNSNSDLSSLASVPSAIPPFKKPRTG